MVVKRNWIGYVISSDEHQDLIPNGLPDSKVNQSCTRPVAKVGFMKTHKTASSTVQNILMRYGMNSGWNFVMLSHGTHLGPPRNQYSLTEQFSSSWIQNVPWKSMTDDEGYNIFALHTKWNQLEVEKVLGLGTKYVTILRDPVDAFESLYNYLNFKSEFNMDLEQFVSTYVSGAGGSRKKHIHRILGYLGRNQQLWDLGLDEDELESQEAVQNKIKDINKDFDLVMISEDFDSSVVLLSNTLCWPLANLTSLQLNARKKSKVQKLSQEARDALKSWLWADYMLYDFFKMELDRKKIEYGQDDLKENVNTLMKLNEKLKEECVIDVVDETENLSADFVPWSKDVQGFKINEAKPHCKYYGIAENQFIEYLRKLQIERFSILQKRKLNQK